MREPSESAPEGLSLTPAHPRTLTLAVADDGHGIEPAAVPRLFRPYFTTKRHGTGLGLFVTRRIVEAHGGAVGVTSVVGQGTTFTVTLPVAETQ